MSEREKEPNLAHIDEESQGRAPRKRLFIALTCATALFLVACLVLLWVIPYYGLTNIHPWAPGLFGAFVGLLVLAVGWAFGGLILNILFGRSVLYSRRIRGLTIKLFLPLMTLLGRALGISKKDIRASFINVNNELVLSEAKTYPPDKILLLMPHCLQMSRCEMRLTYDVNNCKRCGLCPIRDLLEITEAYGVHLAIATGGTIARRIVVQKRPKLIVAVACERDLAEGIQDTYPLPVFGVLNERPNGPCLDTTVSRDHIELALERFIDPAFEAEIKARKAEAASKPRKRKLKPLAVKPEAAPQAEPAPAQPEA